MISYLEGPRDDESLGSLLARIFDRVDVGSANRFDAYFHGGTDGALLHLELPQRLPEIASRFGARLGLDLDAMVQRLTFLPVTAPFMEPPHFQEVLDSFSGKTAMPPARLLRANGHLGSRRPYLRFCPQCRATEIRRYGFTWWRRTHQVSGVECCPIHRTPLARSQFLNVPSWRIDFPLADDACAMEHAPAPSAVTVAVAQGVRWLLQSKLPPLGAVKLREAYVDALEQRGLWCRGRLQRAEFLRQFREFIGKDHLSRYGLDFNPTHAFAWPARVVLTEPRRCRPIHHFLVIHFLGFSVAEFLTRAQTTFDPQRRLARRPQFIVSEKRLRALWKNRALPIKAMAREFGVQPLTVTAQATTLGLPFPRFRPGTRRAKNHHEARRRFRAIWRKFRHRPQSAQRLKARKWLRGNDRAWLIRHRAQRQRLLHNSLVDWTVRDRLLAPQITYVAACIKSQRPFRRICRTSIARQVKPAESIIRHLHQMPLTRKTAEDNIESPRDFILRRIRTIRQSHPDYPPWQVRLEAHVPKHYEDAAMIRAIEQPMTSDAK